MRRQVHHHLVWASEPDAGANQDGLINDRITANRPDSEPKKPRAGQPNPGNAGMGYGSSGPADPARDQRRG